MFCNFCGAPNPDAASFCNKCGKKIAAASPSSPVQAQPIAYITETPSPATPSAPTPAVLTTPARQETRAAIGGPLTPAARTEFTEGLTVEARRQIENKCFPAAIAAWILALVVVARFTITAFGTQTGVIIALVAAFAVAGIVFKIVKGALEDKYLNPIAGLSDEMLVNRYNEAKADRRAASTRSAIGWAVIAIVAVLLFIAWVAAQRH